MSAYTTLRQIAKSVRCILVSWPLVIMAEGTVGGDARSLMGTRLTHL